MLCTDQTLGQAYKTWKKKVVAEATLILFKYYLYTIRPSNDASALERTGTHHRRAMGL